MNATSDSEVIVIDANVAVWAMLPAVAAPGVDAPGRFQAWIQAEIQLIAPTHWIAECISAIRSLVYSRTLTSAEGRAAISALFTDGLYLALADRLGVEFWTADRRLANGARQAGMTSAHWIGEP